MNLPLIWTCVVVISLLLPASGFVRPLRHSGVRCKKIVPSRSFHQNGLFSSESDNQNSIPHQQTGKEKDTFGTHKVQKRSFPKKAYHLAKDEENLPYNFISFIDHTLDPYTQIARLVEPRLYARPDQFEKDNYNVPPTIDDVAPPPSLYGTIATFLAWNRIPARAVVGGLSYLSFPLIISLLDDATQNVNGDAIQTLVNTFLPGVSIVLGTYFSLTLSILYDRLSRMQRTVSQEASLLSMAFLNLMDLFHNDPEAAVEGAQCVADQIATLVRESRGREIMRVIYSDPYARILRLVKDRDEAGNLDSVRIILLISEKCHNETQTSSTIHMIAACCQCPPLTCFKQSLLADVRKAVNELFAIRSVRMSDEALGLTPTHFDVMTFLAGLLLVGFALGTVATSPTGMPSGIARVLFSVLVVCYTIFYEMAYDLNRPFDGVYQIRRSGAAMHFLQVKHMITNHPTLCGRVDFNLDTTDEEDEETEPFSAECVDECRRRKSKIWYN